MTVKGVVMVNYTLIHPQFVAGYMNLMAATGLVTLCLMCCDTLLNP